MKKKIIVFIIAVLIIVGIVIMFTAGLNMQMMKKEHNQMQIDLEQEFNNSDIKQITDEVFQNQTVEVQKIGELEEQVLISTESISEEQRNSFVSKINEKYEKSYANEDIQIVLVPKTTITDTVMPYMWTFIVSTVLVLVYFAFRFKKLELLKVLIQTVLGIVILELSALSILAITRVQVGDNLLSIVFITYFVAIGCFTGIYEKKLSDIRVKETQKK